MLNSLAAGRRAALRAVAWQAIAAVLVSLAFLAQNPRSAAAAGIAGGSLALGSAIAARVALGGVVSARVAFSRLLLGMMAKWCVVVVTLMGAFGIWRLPPVPMLAGLTAGLLAYALASNGSPGSSGSDALKPGGKKQGRESKMTTREMKD